jgi:hypothetical protein
MKGLVEAATIGIDDDILGLAIKLLGADNGQKDQTKRFDRK